MRSQSQAKVVVNSPMELLGIDFIGPFPRFDNGYNWILICADYFSRFTWAEATERNDSDTVIRFLKTLFETFGFPIGKYSDPGPHFGSKTLQFAKEVGIIWCHAPVAAKRAVGMIEKCADILQRTLKKCTSEPRLWPSHLPEAV